MATDWVDLPDEWLDVCPPHIELHVTDPEVVGVILGPDGAPLVEVLDRRVVPFGFQR